MDGLLTKLFGPNWRTSVGGILIGLPPIVSGAALAANITLGKWVVFACALAMGVGGLILGTNSKDKQVHSTAEEVQASTLEAAKEKP